MATSIFTNFPAPGEGPAPTATAARFMLSARIMRIQLAIGIWSSAFIASLGLGVGCSATEPLMGCDGASNTDQNGFVTCSSETVHRPRVEACELTTPRSDFECVSSESSGPDGCAADADCTAEANGYCSLLGAYIPSCQCSYGCAQDSDCGENQVCQCNGVAGECKPASCAQDADCPSSVCASYNTPNCDGRNAGFACVTTRDECLTNDDCAEGGCYFAEGRRSCSASTCTQGRPFLVQSEIRTATLRPGSHWNLDADQQPNLASAQHLPSSIRTEIAAHYLHNGLMEHASIAAFARFTLQLMGLGAPRDLVTQSIAAQADELRHAELCFGVAAHIGDPQGGGGLEPAELDLTGAMDSLSPESVLFTTILEGCIGETVAAALAEEAALLCTDPALQSLHRRIAADEARHAQLAWRSVAWLLSAYPELKPVAARQFSAAAASRHAETPEAPATTARLEAYGVLSRERSAALHNAVLRDVIGPAARAVLAATSELPVGMAAA